METVEAARAKKRSEKDEPARATFSANIESLEARDKKSDAKAAVSAANASRRELDALRAQQKSTFCPAETLGKQEILVVDEGLASHNKLCMFLQHLIPSRIHVCIHKLWVMFGKGFQILAKYSSSSIA